MKNFNTARTIDLRQYLPDVLKDLKEMQAIMDAETPEVRAIWSACEDCMNDQFLSEATKNGIARREKMLGIIPESGDTLEDRRSRLQSWYTQNIPYTRKSLAAMLSALCGEDGYKLTFLTNEFTLIVSLELTVKKQEKIVGELLDRVLPMNLVFSIELIYNTWEKCEPYTWAELESLTWEAIKEEVLP